MAEIEPLLPDTSYLHREISTSSNKDDLLVGFEPGDPADPVNWPRAYKWGIVALLAALAFTTFVRSSSLSISRS